MVEFVSCSIIVFPVQIDDSARNFDVTWTKPDTIQGALDEIESEYMTTFCTTEKIFGLANVRLCNVFLIEEDNQDASLVYDLAF